MGFTVFSQFSLDNFTTSDRSDAGKIKYKNNPPFLFSSAQPKSRLDLQAHEVDEGSLLELYCPIDNKDEVLFCQQVPHPRNSLRMWSTLHARNLDSL
jgi:hypothetical protein